MSETLAERFMASGGAPIDVGGEEVHLWTEVGPISDTGVLHLSLKASSPRPQAFCMTAKGGTLQVEGQDAPDIVLWSDTAPPHVTVRAQPNRRRAMTIRFWNGWRDNRGVMQFGVGNVGMTATRSSDQITLLCSDGFGDVAFGDLRVEIRGLGS